MSAAYLLPGKARKERGRGAYIKYVSGNATTRNTAWRRHENKSGASELEPKLAFEQYLIVIISVSRVFAFAEKVEVKTVAEFPLEAEAIAVAVVA